MKRLHSWAGILTRPLLFCLLSAIFVFSEEDRYIQQVRKILREVPLIDGHNDLAHQIMERFGNRIAEVDLRSGTEKLDPPMHTDLQRLRAGGVGGQFWSVYVSVDYSGSEAVQRLLHQMDVIHRIIAKYPESLELARRTSDIFRIHKAGKVASMIGVEGGHTINNSLAVLRMFYQLGARYMTLTHWKSTDWADAATDDPKYGGLTPFGEEVVHEMNRLGMLVDISHVSEQTMEDVLNVTQAPILFSHSSVRALCPHPRNLPDSILKRLPQNDGVVMINFAPSFVSEEVRQYEALLDGEEARLKALFLGDPEGMKQALEEWKNKNPRPVSTLEQVVDHIDYVKKIAGIDHVGLGSDFDGISTTPLGLEDVSRYPNLLAELLRRGYSEEEVKKVAGLNVLRVLRKAEEVAARLQKEKPPSEVQNTITLRAANLPRRDSCRFNLQD